MERQILEDFFAVARKNLDAYEADGDPRAIAAGQEMLNEIQRQLDALCARKDR